MFAGALQSQAAAWLSYSLALQQTKGRHDRGQALHALEQGFSASPSAQVHSATACRPVDDTLSLTHAPTSPPYYALCNQLANTTANMLCMLCMLFYAKVCCIALGCTVHKQLEGVRITRDSIDLVSV